MSRFQYKFNTIENKKTKKQIKKMHKVNFLKKIWQKEAYPGRYLYNLVMDCELLKEASVLYT